MKQEHKESLIKLAKVVALFVVGLIGIMVSANSMNTGGFYLFLGIMNLGITGFAVYSLYKLLKLNSKPRTIDEFEAEQKEANKKDK